MREHARFRLIRFGLALHACACAFAFCVGVCVCVCVVVWFGLCWFGVRLLDVVSFRFGACCVVVLFVLCCCVVVFR